MAKFLETDFVLNLDISAQLAIDALFELEFYDMLPFENKFFCEVISSSPRLKESRREFTFCGNKCYDTFLVRKNPDGSITENVISGSNQGMQVIYNLDKDNSKSLRISGKIPQSWLHRLLVQKHKELVNSYFRDFFRVISNQISAGHFQSFLEARKNAG